MDQQKVGSQPARRLVSLHTIAAEPHDTEALLESVLCELVLLMDCITDIYMPIATMTPLRLVEGATSKLGVDHGRKWSAAYPCNSGVQW